MGEILPSLEIFNSVYDKFSPMLYSIALEITNTVSSAEDLLSATFHEAFKQNLINENNSSVCACLIKLLFQTAANNYSAHLKKEHYNLKRFSLLPALQKALCHEPGIQKNTNENMTSIALVSKLLKEELDSLRSIKTKPLLIL